MNCREECTILSRVDLLLSFLVQFLSIFLEDAVGVLGYQKPDTMDLSPSTLRDPNMWSCAWSYAAQRRYSEVCHHVRLPLDSRI